MSWACLGLLNILTLLLVQRHFGCQWFDFLPAEEWQHFGSNGETCTDVLWEGLREAGCWCATSRDNFSLWKGSTATFPVKFCSLCATIRSADRLAGSLGEKELGGIVDLCINGICSVLLQDRQYLMLQVRYCWRKRYLLINDIPTGFLIGQQSWVELATWLKHWHWAVKLVERYLKIL